MVVGLFLHFDGKSNCLFLALWFMGLNASITSWTVGTAMATSNRRQTRVFVRVPPSYSRNFPRYGSALCFLTKGPIAVDWILLLDCAVLPHANLAQPEPSGTPHTLSQNLKFYFLDLGKHPLVAWWDLLYLVCEMIKTFAEGPMRAFHSSNVEWATMKLTFHFCRPSLCSWSVWPRMSATCCRATYGGYLLESYWSWSSVVCVFFWGCCSSHR